MGASLRDGDVVGFLSGPAWLRGRHYSASLHLASRISQGGLELFAFAFADGQHAVLALQESRPLPGFDYLGDKATARTLVEEFMAIQRGQPMRLVGNTDGLEGREEVSPEDLFVEPAKSARLRSLRSWRAVRRGLVFAVLAVAAGFGVDHYLEQRRQETLKELQASSAYQQKIYQSEMEAAWSALPPSSDAVLRGGCCSCPACHCGRRAGGCCRWSVRSNNVGFTGNASMAVSRISSRSCLPGPVAWMKPLRIRT